MKTLSITAPDEIFNQTVEALCHRGGYSGDAADSAAKLVFSQEQVITLLNDVTRDYAAYQIRQSAQQQAQTAILAANAQIAATRPDIVVAVE